VVAERVKRTRIGNRRLRQLLTVAAAIVAAGAAIAAYETDSLQAFELPAVDLRFAVRGPEPPPRDVVLVAIDPSTFNQLGLQWPFPRSLHGRVIDTLKRDGARAIAYDIQFTEPSQPAQDNALYAAVARAGNVVLGTTFVGRGGATNVLGGDANLRAAHAVIQLTAALSFAGFHTPSTR
jgi:adenylate cyclase